MDLGVCIEKYSKEALELFDSFLATSALIEANIEYRTNNEKDFAFRVNGRYEVVVFISPISKKITYAYIDDLQTSSCISELGGGKEVSDVNVVDFFTALCKTL